MGNNLRNFRDSLKKYEKEKKLEKKAFLTEKIPETILESIAKFEKEKKLEKKAFLTEKIRETISETIA